MAKGKRRSQTGPDKLWVFAQYPVAQRHMIIPVLAARQDEAIRLAADPQRIGKPLTPKVIAGLPGVTDGQRDFLIFDDQERLMQFLSEHLGGK